MTSNYYQAQYRIRWQDIDSRGNLATHALASLFQETAWRHAEDLGFGFGYMAQHQAIWVLLGVRIHFFKQARWEDLITIKSWHKGYHGAIAKRDFILSDMNGEDIARACTDWTIINHETRRIVRPSLLDPFSDTIINEDALPPFDMEHDDIALQQVSPYTVCFSDLDFNGHVNNARYFEWISNTFEPVNADKLSISNVTMKYVSECFLGDNLLLRHALSGKTFHIEGIRPADGKKIFEAVLSLTENR